MKVAKGLVIALALVCVAASKHALAQDKPASGTTASSTKPPPPVTSPWSASLTSYVWFAGLNGDVGVRNLPSAHYDVGFSDIFDKIDWTPPPVMLVGELRYDRFALITDFIYLGVEDSVTGSGPLQVKADATL